MNTIRYNVYETNSSSCHSITFCSGKEWNDFVNHKVCWIRDNWSIDEHSSTTHTVCDEDKIDVTELFKKVLEILDDEPRFLNSYSYRGYHPSEDIDAGMILDLAVFRWLKKEITTVDKLVEYCTSTNDDLRIKLEKPFDVQYSWNDKPTHYEDFGLYSIRDVLKKIIELAYGCYFPYFYGDDCWDKKHAGIVVTGDAPKVIQVDIKDGALIEADDFIISRDGDVIKIKFKAGDKVIIERDEEC